MLIDANGKKLGVISIDEALQSAKDASLDLVQVSPNNSDPVVCKLLDYGKHLFDKKKSVGSNKNKVKRNTTKEIKFRPSTDIGDYNIKLKKIKSFILDGDKTKISVRFRGREILNSDMGLNLLNKLRLELESIAQVDQEPSLEGRQLLMVLSPLKKRIKITEIMTYKLKTHSGAAKRFKKTGSSVKSRSANRNHILTKQSTKRKRHNRGLNKLSGTVLKMASALIRR